MTRVRLIVKPRFAALVHVSPLDRETQTIAPIRRVAPYATLGPVLSAVSPAQTIIGELLAHVLEHPADNVRERLLARVRGT